MPWIRNNYFAPTRETILQFRNCSTIIDDEPANSLGRIGRFPPSRDFSRRKGRIKVGTIQRVWDKYSLWLMLVACGIFSACMLIWY
jgi:hypothetical protein